MEKSSVDVCGIYQWDSPYFSVVEIFCNPTENTENIKCMSLTCLWRPSSIEMKEYSSRVKTFDDWPSQMKQKAVEMASCGFYYVKFGDKVKCFQCGLGLGNWNKSDKAYEAHILHSSNCSYIKSIKPC